MRHDRAKHEAMLRREMLATLARLCPDEPEESRSGFAEAFVRMSRPPEPESQGELFEGER